MKLKIMVTGHNKKIIEDVCEHLKDDRGYLPVKCAPNRGALFDMTLSEIPKVAIVCLGDETVDSIKAYNVLRDMARQGGCSTIVIANDEDETFFKKYTGLEKVFFLSRPVSLFMLYEKLTEIEEELKKNAASQAPKVREYQNDSGRKRRKHILVVDDDPEQLVHIKEQLDEFYEVTLVKSGDAALKYMAKHIPDLVLLDYVMPGTDGPKVLRSMKLDDDFRRIPVIFLTGMTEKSKVLQTLTQLRPEGYIIKPAKKSELVAKIIDVLG